MREAELAVSTSPAVLAFPGRFSAAVTISSKAVAALREGRALTGYFVPRGLEAEVPGVLSWSFEGGARLDLIGDTSAWPEVGSPHFVVHGWLRDGGDVSLMHAWVKTVAMTDQVTALRSSTLALGEQVELDTRWTRAFYSTANLSEWRRDSGLAYSHPAPRARPNHFRVDWRPPTRDEVDVPGARLIFRGTRDASVGYSADWSITTWQDLVVNPEQPLTQDDGWRRFASPLLNFMSFASDRPDGIVREILVDLEDNRRIEVWRQGQTVRPRQWQPVGGYLFHAEHLNDYAAAINTWWALDDQLRPALGLFAEHISYGRSYSPARFLTLYTAMEAYARDRHGRNDFRVLREYAGVPTEVMGCTNKALALIGASRRYFAHLGSRPDGPTVNEIEANMLLSTRRASALMQACLLRDVGFSAPEVEDMLGGYYSRWPLS
jgi:ApeA N-terminal domain 1